MGKIYLYLKLIYLTINNIRIILPGLFYKNVCLKFYLLHKAIFDFKKRF